jgi:hypothetical protein
MRFWRTLGLATLAAAFRFERSFIHSRADEDLVHIGYRLLNTVLLLSSCRFLFKSPL